MQCLEVSGAVRLLYKLLGVKRLIMYEYYRRIPDKFQSKGTIFREKKMPIFINQLLMESYYL